MASDFSIQPFTPSSFFSLSEELIHNTETERPFHRICEIMSKSSARTLLIHRHVEQEDYFRKLYPHLVQELAEKDPELNLEQVAQVTFLQSHIEDDTSLSTLRAKLKSDDILATCVIVALSSTAGPHNKRDVPTGSFVYEAIVRTSSLRSGTADNKFPQNYTHVGSRLQIRVLGKGYTIPGTYFMQENGIDCVCAQACLKMSIIHVDGEKANRIPPTSGRINQIIGEAREQAGKPKLQPLDGLTITDIRESLFAENAHPLVLDTGTNSSALPYEWAYLLIESGIPTLVAFCSEEDEPNDKDEPELFHVMPVVGHTLNGDKWLPMAQIFYEEFDSEIDRKIHSYRSTAEWACHLVVHDDVLGPYYCMSKHDLLFPPVPDKEPKSRIRYVVGVVPADAGFTFDPYTIQQVACNVFWENWETFLPSLPEQWKIRFEEKPFSENTLVLRTQLCERVDYLKYLSDGIDELGNHANISDADLKILRKHLPIRFWVTEFSLPETYAVNQSTFGEILLDFAPTRSDLYRADDPDAGVCLAMRFVNNIQIDSSRHVKLGFKSHGPLLRRKGVKVAY